MTEQGLVKHEEPMQAISRREEYLPVMSMGQAQERRGAVVEFIKSIMVEDQDYGLIPGARKPSLYKPGAEKLANFFGLEPSITTISKEQDWTGADHGGEPFFNFEYQYELHKGGRVAGVGVGSCNSWESKYRWRKGERVCPACGTAAIIKGKEEYGGGWVCFKKKDGCNAKFPDGDQAIESQQVGRIPNPDIFDQVNTFQKMAKKRAQIDATLNATSASEFYTQDVEDLMGHSQPQAQRPPQPPPPPSAPPEESKWSADLVAKFRKMSDFAETVKVIEAHKAEIDHATGSEKPYYEILGRFDMQHANDLKGRKLGELRGLVSALHEYVLKVTAEPPLGVTQDDVPVGEDL